MLQISPLSFSEEHEIAIRRLRALIEGLPITFATHVAGGFLFLVLFWNPNLRVPLLIWYVVLLATVGARAAYYVYCRKFPPQPVNYSNLLALFLAGVFLSASVWGGVITIPPHYGHGIDNLLKALIVSGLLAGAMMSLSYWKWAFLTFAFPATVPVIYVLLAENTRLGILIAIGLCILLFFLYLVAEKIDEAFICNEILQERNNSLIVSLQEEHNKVRRNFLHSEDKYSRIFHASPLPMIIISLADDIIADVNESFLEFSGYGRADLIENKAGDLNFWSDGKTLNRLSAHLKNESRIKNMEVKFHNRAGVELQCLFSGEMIFIEDHPYLLAMLINVTQERLLHEQLRLSEEKFSKAFKSLPDPITISRLADGILVDVNDSCLAISGYSRNELIGKNVFELGVWRDPAQRETIVRKLAAHGRVHNEEADFVRKNGAISHCLVSVEIINVYGIPHMLFLTREITEQKQAQAALVESENRFRQLVENMHDGLGITDMNGTITYVNNRICEMLKWSRAEIEGRPITVFVDGKNLLKIRKRLEERSQGMHEPYEITWIARDGSKVLTRVHPSPLFDADGKITGSFALIELLGRAH